MKKVFTLFIALQCVLIASAALGENDGKRSIPQRSIAEAEANEDLLLLDHFIQATGETLEASRQLREKISAYFQLQQIYLQDPSNKDTAYHMVKTARLIMEEIEEHHLNQIFTPDFMNELSFFSELSKKRGLPQP